MNDTRPKSVHSLQDLYTVVIGLALSLAVETLLGSEKTLSGTSLPSWLLFGAFVVTLFPFYHGALRHLDDAYAVERSRNESVVLFDLLLLFIHALAFIFLSLLLSKPAEFAWVLFVVFSIDIVWGVFTRFAASSSEKSSPESKWAKINAVFVACGAYYLVRNHIYFAGAPDSLSLSLLVFLACAIRTIVDYSWCNSFYFPVSNAVAESGSSRS